MCKSPDPSFLSKGFVTPDKDVMYIIDIKVYAIEGTDISNYDA